MYGSGRNAMGQQADGLVCSLRGWRHLITHPRSSRVRVFQQPFRSQDEGGVFRGRYSVRAGNDGVCESVRIRRSQQLHGISTRLRSSSHHRSHRPSRGLQLLQPSHDPLLALSANRRKLLLLLSSSLRRRVGNYLLHHLHRSLCLLRQRNRLQSPAGGAGNQLLPRLLHPRGVLSPPSSLRTVPHGTRRSHWSHWRARRAGSAGRARSTGSHGSHRSHRRARTHR